MKRAVMMLTILACAPLARAAEPAAPPVKAPQHWMHLMIDLQDEKALANAAALLKRASAASYNGVVVHDPKFLKYHIQPASYVANLKTFRQACQDNKIAFIPCVMPMGYAGKMLAFDPNLAEGMPVRAATFKVTGGKLVPVEEGLAIVNPSFEELKAGLPVGWDIDSPGKVSFVDEQVKADGNVSVRQQDPGSDKAARARVIQKLKVKRWHYYHVSVRVRTQDCTSKDFRVMALSGGLDAGMVLNWQPPDVKPTMDWTRLHATFNSLDNDQVTLLIGCWNGKQGKVWFDDVKIEPGGFVNVIRRDSLPLKITSEDGKTEYAEGKDFSAVKDPRLMNDPELGFFGIWHEVPDVTVPAGGALKEGQPVRASYHYATNAGKDFQINCCFSEPRTYQIMEDTIAWLKENTHPDMYMMSHDEIRHLGWDDSCAQRNLTCGQLLADNIAKCTAIIERVDPGKPMFVWSDMFDPHHNARKAEDDGGRFVMYLAKGDGPWYGSWEGLGRQVGIVNWSGGKAESYKFFAGRGHQQIISGVDPGQIARWLKESGANPGVVGVMYTSWTSNYDNLEKYIEAVKQWEQSVGYK